MAKQLNVSLAVTADTGQAKQQLQQLQQTLQQLTTNSANLKIGISAEEIQKASQAALELSAHLKTATNVNTGTIDFTKLNSSIRSSGQSLEAYGQQLIKLGPQGKQAFMQLAQSVAQSEIPIKRLSGLLGNFGTVLSNTIRWQLSSSMIHGFMGAIQGAYGYAQDLNKSLNNIQIVTQMSDNEMAQFAVSANKAAKALSTTTTSYTDAALIYYQQGIRNQKEIAERTDATIKMANVTGQSAQEVSNQMTAIWNNFAKGGESLEYYADVITALGAATASSSAEISQGLQKFAAIADTVGLSYENATAALATITATTRQSADTVGTGLRTVFSRLQSLSLGETLDDGVTLTKYSKAMQTIGVNVLDATGNLRDMNDVLMDMGSTWQNLTEAQKMATAQTIGGVRQYTTIMALMENFDFYKENLNIAKTSEGTLQKQQETFEKSWKAAALRVRASAESIYSSLINDKFFTDLTDNFAKFLDIINQIISGLGGVKGVLLSLGGALTSTFSNQVAGGLYKFGVGVRNLFTPPKALAAKRESFIANAAGVYAGLPIDSKTGYIQGAVFDKTTGQLDLSNVRMSNSQRQAYNMASQQLAIQQAYSRNNMFMSPAQQQAALMAMDRQSQTANAYLQAKEAERLAQQNVSNKISLLYDQALTSNKTGSLHDLIARGRISQDEAATALDSIRTTFETQDREYSNILNILNGMKDGNISQLKTNFTEDQLALLGIKENEGLGSLDILLEKITQKRLENRTDTANLFKRMGGTPQAFSVYANAFQDAINKGLTKEEADKAAKQAIANAQEMAGKTSIGMKISQGITNFAGGIMSASAAQQGLESLSNVINQVNAGLMSTKDAAIQGTAAIAQMAFNGVRSFNQFSSALTPFLGSTWGAVGGAIATIATIALPYIIEGIDRLNTTPEEMIENINHSTETAEQSAISAKNAYDNLMSSFSSNTALLDSLDELTQGTLEFEQALISANNAMYALINENKLSASDWYVDSRGAVQIKDEAKERLQQESLNEMKRTQSESLAMQSLQKTLEAQIDYDKIKELYDKAKNQYDSKIFEIQGDIDYYEDVKVRRDKAQLTSYEWGYYGADLDSRIENLQSQLTSITPDYSQLEKYAKENNIPFDALLNQLTSGQFLQNQLLSSGAFSANKSYFVNKILSASQNKTTLTTAEQLIVDALSMSDSVTQAQNKAINIDSFKLKPETETIQVYGPEEGAQSVVEGAEFKNFKLTDEALLNWDLENIKSLYETFGGENAIEDLKSILESAEYQTAIQNGEDAGKKYILEKLQAYRSDRALDQEYTKALEALTPDLEKRLNRVYELNDEQAMSLIKDLASSENPFIQELSNTVLDTFTKEQQEFLKAVALSTEDDEERQKYYDQATQMSLNERKAVEQIRGNFLNAYGEDTGNLIFKRVMDDLGEQSTAIKNAAQAFSFSGSNITDLAKLKSSTSSFGEFKAGSIAQQLYESILKDIGGEKGLFEELYQSEDFADGLKKLQKQLKTTGKIGAEAILEIADETELLSDLLEVSDINAQGLADAISSLESGSIDNISSALLRALSAAGEVENTLAKVYSHIDSFQQERSAQDIGKFYKGLADSVQDSLESGMLLDAPLLQGLEEVFGSGKRVEYQQLIYDLTNDDNLTPEQISDQINKNFEAEFTALQSIQERGNLSGLYEYYETKVSQGGKSMFSYNKETGQVEAVDIEKLVTNGWDSEEGFIQGLIDNYGISETLAQSMAAEYGVTNGTISQLWRQTAAKKGLSEFFTGDENILNEADLKTFYNTYQDVLKGMEASELSDMFKGIGLDIDDFTGNINDVNDLLNILQQAASKAGKSIIDLGDNFSFTADNADELLNKKLIEAGEGGLNQFLGVKKEYKIQADETTGVYSHQPVETVNYEHAIKQLKELGASSAEANTFLSQMFDAGKIDEFTYSIKDANNETQILKSTDAEFQNNWEEYGNNIAEAWYNYVQGQKEAVIEQQTMNKQAEMLATALTKAFADGPIDIQFQIAEGNDTSLTEAIQNAIQSVDTNIAIKANTDAINEALATYENKTITVSIDAKGGSLLSFLFPASGYNNAHGFAGGKHINGQYEGLAEAGELGEELWIHDGQPYLVGQKGRTRIYVHKNDEIYTASETRNILDNNPSLQGIPGFSVGYNKVTWGKKGTGASASNAKTSKYEPERYHLITRQLKDLQREYDRLDKIKEECYGTNKLEAIQREIDAQNELITGQKELIKEAEDYLKIDTDRLQKLLTAGEFQVDENGNLLNFEELQEKYRRAAEESKDEAAQDVWKALQQYEETIDKLQEANVEMRDLLYQEMELRLEKITTKAELKIDFDEREIKLLDHYIKRIDDNIYHTAEVLTLTEQKLGFINNKIKAATEGINGIFAELSDSQGNKITKEDGTPYTLEDWLGLDSNEQRDLLDINDNFGKQLEEYMDNILDYIEELEEFKTKGVEEFGNAFEELNDDVRSSIDLFDHYNQLLSSLKNIVDLQGVKLSTEFKSAIKEIDAAMFGNTQNNINAERENYRRLTANVEELRKKVAETEDEILKKQWEDQLKTAEEELRTSENNLLSLWETGLQQAKDMFESALDDAVDSYETAISGMYGTVDELQKAWDQQKKNDEFYVKDYEKYYQISKLQRSINKDLEAAAKNGNRQNQNLKKLYDELNDARENGVELSAYDLDIYAKRYEYEKALMDLEDARNAKSEVRLQRDANSNWGYVYTSAADEDDLITKQQAVDDKFYELQKATQERVASLSDDMMSEITGVGKRLQELYSSGASQETIDEYLRQESKYIENYRKGLAKALEDAGMTEEEARLRYGNEGFDILDKFGESLLSAIMGGNSTLDELFDKFGSLIGGTSNQMSQAVDTYNGQLDAINKWFNESGEDLSKVIKGFASIISGESDSNLIDSKEQIENAKKTFEEILKIADDFEKKFMEKYQPIIDANEKLVTDLLTALYALNYEEYKGPEPEKDNSIADIANSNIKTSSEQVLNSNNLNTNESGSSDNHSSASQVYDTNKWSEDICTHPNKYWKDVGSGYIQEYCPDCKKYLGREKQGTTEIKEKCPPHDWVQSREQGVWYCRRCRITRKTGKNPPSLNTGGYTGVWGSEGRLAMLHEKELVLNAEDTKNFLNATNILRTIDLQANLFGKGLGNVFTPWLSDLKNYPLEQDVHIEALFPNVTNHAEIEEAFDNLINKASQYANRKNMSSMTFQDMYTSKF